MSYLLLHEHWVVAGLDQVRDVGMPQGVQRQGLRQPSALRARWNERSKVRTTAAPARSDGHIARGVANCSWPAGDSQSLRRSTIQSNSHCQNSPSARARALRSLCPADLTRAETPVLRNVRVRTDLDVLQHRQLPASQSVGKGDFERQRVALGRQPALRPGGILLVDDIVGRVEELLKLIESQASTPGRKSSSAVWRGEFHPKTIWLGTSLKTVSQKGARP